MNIGEEAVVKYVGLVGNLYMFKHAESDDLLSIMENNLMGISVLNNHVDSLILHRNTVTTYTIRIAA